eukprot:scaffold50128_cov18-Phaeocystis_antarctica.AAC.1
MGGHVGFGAARRQFRGVKSTEFQRISDLKGVKCKGLTRLLTYTPLRPRSSSSGYSQGDNAPFPLLNHARVDRKGWLPARPGLRG